MTMQATQHAYVQAPICHESWYVFQKQSCLRSEAWLRATLVNQPQVRDLTCAMLLLWCHTQKPQCLRSLLRDVLLLQEEIAAQVESPTEVSVHSKAQPFAWAFCHLLLICSTRAQAAKPSQGLMPLGCHFFPPAHNATVLNIHLMHHLDS